MKTRGRLGTGSKRKGRTNRIPKDLILQDQWRHDPKFLGSLTDCSLRLIKGCLDDLTNSSIRQPELVGFLVTDPTQDDVRVQETREIQRVKKKKEKGEGGEKGVEG